LSASRITQLRPGEGLLFAARALDYSALDDVLGTAASDSTGLVRAAAVFNIHVRRRITADRGASRLNRAAPPPPRAAQVVAVEAVAAEAVAAEVVAAEVAAAEMQPEIAGGAVSV
jgi:hypothetical protein